MARTHPDYILRLMRFEDITQVVAIDQLAFPTPWSASVYRYEIAQNSLSTMMVLCRYEPPPARPAGGRSPLARLLSRLLRRSEPTWHRMVVGYGGFWFSRQEAHVSTIAVHPAMQGHGLGEVMLAGMLRRGLAMNADMLSLEVRVSNAPAIALYEKYGFAPAGVKAHYYRDNNEDAYDMRVQPVDAAYRQHFAANWAALMGRVHVADAVNGK